MKFFASSQDPTNNPFTQFLVSYGIWIAVGVCALVGLAVAFFLIFFKYRGKKWNDEADNIEKKISSEPKTDIYSLLGGKENVVSHDRMKSRIILQLKDDTLVNANKLKGIGVDSIIKMSNKTILVVEQDPETFYSLFN